MPEAFATTRDIEERLGSLGVPENLYRPAMSEESFRALLAGLRDIPDLCARLFPSSFETTGAALPRPLSWRSHTLGRALAQWDAGAVMLMLPLFLQFDIPLSASCREYGSPVFLNDPANRAAAARGIETAGIRTVAALADDAAKLAAHLFEARAPLPRYWFLVHQADAPWPRMAPALLGGAAVAQEVYLMPGTPLLEQCEHLIERGELRFHLASEFSFEIERERAFITSTLKTPVPLLRYEWKVPLMQESAPCACGEPIYLRPELA